MCCNIILLRFNYYWTRDFIWKYPDLFLYYHKAAYNNIDYFSQWKKITYLNICFMGGICTPKNKQAKESFLISYKPSQRISRAKEKTFSIKSWTGSNFFTQCLSCQQIFNSYKIYAYTSNALIRNANIIHLEDTPHTDAIAAFHNFTKCSSFFWV